MLMEELVNEPAVWRSGRGDRRRRDWSGVETVVDGVQVIGGESSSAVGTGEGACLGQTTLTYRKQ